VAVVGVLGTVLLAAGAFSLSFTSLMHLALRCNVEASQAWEWPLIVDGTIVVATVGAVARAGRKGTGYAWLLLAAGALVSVTGNALQAIRLPSEEPVWVNAAVAMIPPIALLATTHMTVILTRGDEKTTAHDSEVSTPDATLAASGVDTGVAGMGVRPASVSPGMASGPTTMGAPVLSISPGTPPVPARRTVVDGDDIDGDGSRTFKAAKAQNMRAAGFSTAEIAQALGVSTGSVRRYLKPSPSADQTGALE
jgi:hypothetical protein